ncbi:hypothetical protein ABT352_30770 [Streptosporangium sp. NPDC000563]
MNVNIDFRRQASDYPTEQKIRCGAHKSVRALEKNIRAWITDWNAAP